MPPSTHEDTGGIDADEEHDRTASYISGSDTIQTPTKKRFCTFAVNTGLTDSPGLPSELRLMVYKAAFPEMDRSIVDEKTGHIARTQLVSINRFRDCFDEIVYWENYWNGLTDEDCTCFPYMQCKHNQLRVAFMSNFARDPTTRVEFLKEYLHQAQFFWIPQVEENLDLWQFLSILALSGLLGEMKHLTIKPSFTIFTARARQWGNFYETAIGRTFAVLYNFRVKCELTLCDTSPAYIPFLDRIVEICKTSLSRDEIDKYFKSGCSDPRHSRYIMETQKLFQEDGVINEWKKRFEKNRKGLHRSESLCFKHATKISC